MPANKFPKVHPGGRPTKLTEDTIAKLESILKIGGSIIEACSYAQINPATYYRNLEKSTSFAMKMEAAQHYSDIAAKHLVAKAIIEDRDLQTAKWWLENREFKKNQLTAVQVNIKNEFQKELEEFSITSENET